MPKVVNGVDVIKSMEMIDLVKHNRHLGLFTIHASSQWSGAGASDITVHRNYAESGNLSEEEVFKFNSILPPVWSNNSTQKAISACPTEMLLMSLSLCLTVGITCLASIQNIEVRKLNVDVKGDIDFAGFYGLEAKRPGYHKIVINFEIEADVPKEELLELIEEVKRTSPVLDTLSNSIDDVESNLLVE